MKNMILGIHLSLLMFALPTLSQAKVRGGMLGLGIGGSVLLVGGGAGALISLAGAAANRDWASGQYSDSPAACCPHARNGKYYTSIGNSYLDAAEQWDRLAWILGGAAVVGGIASAIGFLNMSDGQPSERRSRRQKAQADESGLAPVLDYSDGSLMAMLPDVNLDPVGNKAEARLLRVEF